MLIKDIIFDLGGVIEAISPNQVITTFAALGMKNAKHFFSLYRQSDICSKFETGAISSRDFIQHVQKSCENNTSEKAIIDAWCANQLGVSDSILSVIKALRRRHYKLYILSNTNCIHYQKIKDSFYEKFNERLESLFEQVFLSYQLKARKPGFSLYQKIIDQGIDPTTSVYIDDLEENLRSPQALGFTTILHKTNSSIDYLLSRFP